MTKRLVYILGAGLCLLSLVLSNRATAQIEATRAFDSPGCSDSNLGGHEFCICDPITGCHCKGVPSQARANPEYKVIILPGDIGRPITDLPKFTPTILEGFVSTPPPACNDPECEGPNKQMSSEVSEEETPWNHYTHDFTLKVVPDAAYKQLLSFWLNPDGSTEVHDDMEVEWDNGSVMKVNDDDDRTWGALPEFAWPAIGDRVWVEGRWVFDCGHPFPDDWSFDFKREWVKYSTEIHPPRALVTFRLNHPALSDSPSSSSPAASWLQVTGAPVQGLPGPTPVPVTEADIFVSGNGGGVNDLCMLVPSNSDNDCQYGHTSPVIPVNERNYVFDIYPPGTDYTNTTVNGNFQVTPPVPDASLQWRIVDQSSQIPVHATGVPTVIRRNLSLKSAAYDKSRGIAVDCANCPTGSIAASFTPTANLVFGGADLALQFNFNQDDPHPNRIELSLQTSDASGLPSGATLDSWTLGNLPLYTSTNCCPVQKISAHQPIALTGGVKYWIVANYSPYAFHNAALWMANSIAEVRDWAACCDGAGHWVDSSMIGFAGPALDVYSAAPAGTSVDPIICLLDDNTGPPTQMETSCPAVPAKPTRVRAILPFRGSQANYFAKSILLGWDDVPAPPANSAVRTFKATLHGFTVVSSGKLLPGADWRVFANVGGQYRYISPLWDRKPDGTNVCHGDDLTNNSDGDCFLFDRTPWIVSVQDGTPIHVAVGGYVSEGVDSDFLGAASNRWRYPDGDDPFGTIDKVDLATNNDDRIGPYEFDLCAGGDTRPSCLNPLTDYQWILPDGTTAKTCDANHQGGSAFTTNKTNDGESYKVEFCVDEIQPATQPSSTLAIGLPQFSGSDGTYISATTPMIPQTADTTVKGFQYRFHKQGGVLPTYSSPLPFPVHWTNVDLPPGVHSAEVRVGSANSGDGPYDFQYSAQSSGNVLEPRRTATVVLDTTPPGTTIVQPAATQYSQSASLTLNYTVDDGAGSGVQSFTPKMDGATTMPDGTPLDSGVTISLSQLSLGTHTFSIDSVDNVNNAGTKSVTFTLVAPAGGVGDGPEFVLGGYVPDLITGFYSQNDAFNETLPLDYCWTPGCK